MEICKVENRIIYSDALGNEIRFSAVRNWNGKARFSGMSAKFVLQGEENYHTSEKKYSIREGEYLIGNQNTVSEVCIQSKKDVLGLCIDISKEMVLEVGKEFVLESDFYDFLFQQQLIVNKYNQSNSLLGKELEIIAALIHSNESFQFNLETFKNLSQSLIIDQIQIYQNYGRLKFKKQFTKKEIFSQLMIAKDFMELNWNKSLELDDIAKEAGMSKFHFTRVFKDVFGVSPYQHFIKIKMHHALSFLKKEETVQFVSEILGYPDLSSFSKAFSKYYGLPPSLFRKLA